ncbi:hypothetical protein [Curtobacterium sp. MCBD17_003]|uniref:hypothetical protein n=1 Tax=Curtobacterium sp. MCBD17_003 TaxID=2175667 RepID=UPI0011B803D5|nr:hypothetical protein [Curtobacterium sp. MCBD17_003]WIE54198.1 hypothetical protein DEI88_013900 [Curtobacterium sp. MCBD17_003]
MPRSSDFLNEKQVRVLTWVANGAPKDAYPPGDYAHRITAKALASRGLVSIEGHGASWRATVTEAGAARVTQLTPTLAESLGSADDAVADLRTRLDAAGGDLDVDGREDDVDYPKLVWRFNKSEHRPRGKELRLTYPDWRDRNKLRLEYRDWFWDLVEEPQVASVKPGLRLGHLAKRFLEVRADQFVTKESLPRAARVIEAIVRHAEKQGMKVRDPREVDERKQRHGEHAPGWSGHVELDAHDTVVRLQVREIAGRGGERFDYYRGGEFDRKRYDAIQKLPTWQRNRNYWFVPTGRLEVRVSGVGGTFDASKWPDKRTVPVEDRLGEVFRYIEVHRLEALASKRRAEEAEQLRARQWEQAMSRARDRFRLQQQRALVLERASAWRQYQDLTDFVGELRRRATRGSEELGRWVELAESTLEELDPFRDLAAPAFASPNPDDLRPYLNGWSPYGPTRG